MKDVYMVTWSSDDYGDKEREQVHMVAHDSLEELTKLYESAMITPYSKETLFIEKVDFLFYDGDNGTTITQYTYR